MASNLEPQGEELNRLKEENEKLRSMTFSLVGLGPSRGQMSPADLERPCLWCQRIPMGWETLSQVALLK